MPKACAYATFSAPWWLSPDASWEPLNQDSQLLFTVKTTSLSLQVLWSREWPHQLESFEVYLSSCLLISHIFLSNTLRIVTSAPHINPIWLLRRLLWEAHIHVLECLTLSWVIWTLVFKSMLKLVLISLNCILYWHPEIPFCSEVKNPVYLSGDLWKQLLRLRLWCGAVPPVDPYHFWQ